MGNAHRPRSLGGRPEASTNTSPATPDIAASPAFLPSNTAKLSIMLKIRIIGTDRGDQRCFSSLASALVRRAERFEKGCPHERI